MTPGDLALRARRDPQLTALVLSALVLGGLGLVLLAGLRLTLAIIGSVLLARAHRARQHRRGTESQQRAAIPDGVEMLIILIGTGCSPARALEELATLGPEPLRPALTAVQHHRARGRSLPDALGALPAHLGPMVIPLVDALRAAQYYGTPLAPALDRIADQMQRERRSLAEARVRTLSVQITFPLVCCILPAFALGALAPVVIGALRALDSLGPPP